MSARPVAPGVWFAAFVASCCIIGCGLELDYGPPNRIPMDSGAADGASDSGGIAIDGGNCASSCDDGLRCTADTCVAGVCQHADTCPANTDCVSRGGAGECRRACVSASDCDDGISCTTDHCDAADGHCSHSSNCQDGRPICLASGACAPDHCSSDDECSDGDLCNGSERCVSNVCRAGTPVACADVQGCRSEVCEPSTGTCAPVLDPAACADAYSCTSDVCNPDGSCAHPPNHALCIDANLCVDAMCNPTASPDASGCAPSGGMSCGSACGTSIPCNPATGLCDYTAACPVGQICRADGCHAPSSCTSSSACVGIHGPSGCPTLCMGGTCQPLICSPPPAGGCGRLAVDGMSCPYGDHCQYVAVPSLCDDLDPITIDTCNPATFACSHQCPAASANDCVTYTYAMGRCVPSFDAMTCTRLHGTGGGAGDCARSTCVGHDAAQGGGSDGCAPRGVDSLCTDSAGCTTDTCQVDASDGVGTCHSQPRSDVATYCSDAMACTADACDPSLSADATGCTHTPDDSVCAAAAGSLECATAICAQTGSAANSIGSTPLPTGCAATYMPSRCVLNPGICTLDGRCTVVPCSFGTRLTCDDGVPCNGTESCDVVLGRCAQVPVVPMCPTTGGCVPVCTSAGCVQPSTVACGVVTAMPP